MVWTWKWLDKYRYTNVYIEIDRNTENVCDIHNETCSESGVMLRLLLMKDKQDSDIHTQDKNEGLAHGISIIKHLTLTWDNSE